ncbi:ABC transporter permease [Nocardioides coralli]|uniref:ABC transporter permease n=1 Tax=Nocardioides coralli TaxID=2872154 RepID=UPI001CA3883E|nr:ABC transporter permease [Nocardioides coralli]QZY30414.1 ABC transporter permease [Nocardioides coralli]
MATLTLAEGTSRQLDYWWTVYKRTWKATIVSSFISPIFYVLAMGVLLGGFIAGDPDRLEGATSYLTFVVPGLVAAHAMQTAVGETTYPVMGAIKWHKTYYSQIATPLEPLHLVAGHLMYVLFRLITTCGVYMLVLAPFGVFATWWGPFVAFAAQVLVGMVFAVLVFGWSARLRSEAGFGVLFRLGVIPLFLLSGAFFPITNLGEVGAWLARLTPLWHGVNLSRMFSVDAVDWPVAAANVVVLVVLLVVGWFWSVSGLSRRLVL